MLASYKILTITHRKTPLQAIGQFVIAHSDEVDLKEKLASLQARFGLDELIYLATCNRVLYFFYTEQPLENDFKQAFFQTIQPELSAEMIAEHVNLLEGSAAAEHLFKVAASIDSLVVGEREILRQLREAYERCQNWGLTGDHLRLAMQHVVVAAKEVYGDTRLGEKSVSVVSLAVKEMLKTTLHKDARILMIGAGQTNQLVAKFLSKYGFQNVSVFNRTLAKAQQLAKMLKGSAHPLSELKNFQGGFDCLIVCTGATEAVIDAPLYAQLLQGEKGRKVVIDLSVPNNVAKAVVENFNVHFIEIEGLRALAQENISFREQEIVHANDLLAQRLAEFQAATRHRRIERALHRIPVEIREVKERAMNEVFKKEISALDDSTRLLLERMMSYMEKKCTGIPMKVAKEALAA